MNISHQAIRIAELGRSELNSMPPLGKTTKAGEEFGEFCEQILIEHGLLPHKADKPRKDNSIGELADLIICGLDAISSSRPDLTPVEIAAELETTLLRKTEKWVSVMERLSGTRD